MSSASVKTPVLEPPPRVAAASLNDPSLYIDRELSLLAFQRRVLEEAQDPANALLERVKFLSILFSNLDEFFMVRVAVLKQKAATNVLDGFVAEQLDQIRADVKQVMADAYDTWRDIAKALEGSGIELRSYSQLTNHERSAMEAYFHEVVYPVLTPLAFDPGRPFPHISNLSLNLAVAVRDAKGVERFARVKVPDTLPQLVPVDRSSGGRPVMIWLEHLIIENLQMLFPGLDIIEAYPFRVTRDAEVEIQELESDDLLETIEEAVWQRRFRAVVRLQVSSDIPEHILETLIANLELDRRDVYPRGRSARPEPAEADSVARPAGSERYPVSSAYAAGAESEIGRGHFRGAAPRRSVAAPSFRFLPAGGRIFTARRGRSRRSRDQDYVVSRGAQLAGSRKPAQRHRKRETGRGAGGTESALRRRKQHRMGAERWKPRAFTWCMAWWA